MGLLDKLFGPRRNRTREAATALGIAVLEVERDAPIFNRNGRLERLERGRCVRYSVPLTTANAIPWEFLQRDELPSAEYPNGWTWASDVAKAAPAALRVVLTIIAAEWTEEYLEIEADGKSVHAYWEEWGGAARATVIATYLRRLAEASAATRAI